MSWLGTASETYFIQVTPELGSGWQFIDEIYTGADAPLSYQPQEDLGDSAFFRLHSFEQISGDPWGEDFDGDGVSNRNELLRGSDPTAANNAVARSAPSPAAASYPTLQSGSLLGERWNDVGGYRLDHLRLAWTQLGGPDTTDLQPGLEIIGESGDNDYGSRFRGYLIPPAQGDYQFVLTSDDEGQFWISTNSSPFNKKLACHVWYYAGLEQWNKYHTQKSELISLERGKPVYIEALFKQRGGLGQLKVHWKTPGSTEFVPIPSIALLSYHPHRNDVDDDLLPDAYERSIGMDPASATGAHGAYGDLDGDKLANLFEYQIGTNPALVDTDGDGIDDFAEFYSGTDPLDPLDFLPLSSDPSPWTVSEIGSPSLPGEAHAGGGRILVLGAGSMITPDTPDTPGEDRTFVHQSIDGDFEWAARVQPQVIGRAGLMVRVGLDSGAAMASISVNMGPFTNTRKTWIEQRSTAGNTERTELPANTPYPAWFKLKRRGDVLNFYTSSDGDSWNLQAQKIISFPKTVHYGFFVATDSNPIYAGGLFQPLGMIVGDRDGDGLTDAQEAEYGTAPDQADTDGDGYADDAELFEFFTDPTVADLEPETIASQVAGAEFVADIGDWVVDGSGSYSPQGRGSVTYEVTLPAAAIYRISLQARSRFNQTSLSHYDLKVRVDGVDIGRLSVNGDQVEAGTASILTPWLPAGSHTVEFYVENTYTNRSLQIDGFTLGRIGGPDANSDGIPDWMTHRLSVLNGIENATIGGLTESAVSPFCLLGRSRYLPLSTSVDPAHALKPLPAYGLYADIPLDASSPTAVTVDFENSGLIQHTSVAWVPTNLAVTPALTLRRGDRLRLTAYAGELPGNGQVTITTGDGAAPILTTEGAPVEYTFAQAGQWTLTSTTAVGTHLTEVTVLEADLGETPLNLLWGKARTWAPLALSAAAELSVDAAVLIEENTPVGNPRAFKLTATDTESATLAARLPGDGPVLDHLPLAPFHLASNTETRVEVTEYYDDGAALVEIDFVLADPPPDLRVVVRIFVGGITFQDGSIEKILTIDDFDALGRTTLKFIMPFEAVTSVCHRISIYSGDTFIGQP